MRHISVWVVEFIKLLGGQRLHPIATQCPICQQMVQLHVNKAGRRHVSPMPAVCTRAADLACTTRPR